MANFTAKDVNELRKSTGVGMMDCKKALTSYSCKEGWSCCCRGYGCC